MGAGAGRDEPQRPSLPKQPTDASSSRWKRGDYVTRGEGHAFIYTFGSANGETAHIFRCQGLDDEMSWRSKAKQRRPNFHFEPVPLKSLTKVPDKVKKYIRGITYRDIVGDLPLGHWNGSPIDHGLGQHEKEQERFAKLEIEKAEKERLAAETTERETTT